MQSTSSKTFRISIDDKALKRAGLTTGVIRFNYLGEFEDFLEKNQIGEGYHLATTKTDNLYFDAEFKKGDYILLVQRQRGLERIFYLKIGKGLLQIPMGERGKEGLNFRW